jgi:hypothetical protein
MILILVLTLEGGIMNKYLIAMFFLLSLSQIKSEALDLDGMVMIKEVVKVSNKYKNCSNTKDNKKRLACFDNLTKYIKDREKKYDNIYGLNKEPDDKIKTSKK